MNRWNLGQIYEKRIQDILAEKELLPDHLCGNDAGFKHKGMIFFVEVKNKTAPDFGQKKLTWTKQNGWQWSERDSITDLYDRLGVMKHIDRNFVPRRYTVSANSITMLDKRFDQQQFEKRGIILDNPRYLYEYYAQKNCYYIQIENKGLYHLKNDIANLIVPRFQPELTLRLRAKTHHSIPIYSYSFFAVIQAKTNVLTKSPYDLEEKVGEFPPLVG
jgi:hypothetical protein